jgi:hypothetical protein
MIKLEIMDMSQLNGEGTYVDNALVMVLLPVKFQIQV